VTISAWREAGAVLFAVIDTGVGIAPEDQELVFERFARGGRPGQEIGGVGLGLSLVKSLIELHGGTVALESTPGTGTRVTCRIPDYTAEEPALKAG
jgi:signal transduction histidine kinase